MKEYVKEKGIRGQKECERNARSGPKWNAGSGLAKSHKDIAIVRRAEP